MSNTSTRVPVLIAGGGPTGLVLALTLLKNDIPVRIIDKEPTYHVGSRGAGIFPRTIELYHYLGVLPDVLNRASRKIQPWCVYKLPGGTEPIKKFEMMPYEEPTPSIPWNSAIGLSQASYEAILRDHIAKHGVHVELDTALVGFDQDAEGVTAHIVKRNGDNTVAETVRAHYLVGADGAKGVVRKLLNLTFLGETRISEGMLVGDVHVKGLDSEHWHMWGDFETGFFSLRPTEYPGYYFILSGGTNRDFGPVVESRDALIQFIREATDRDDLEIGHIKWISWFKPNIRMVNKFSEGRVFVAGDAAHVHSPTGAQGMNSSVQDAFNLGWKLASVIKGISLPSLLETYSTERLPVIREMLKHTTSVLNKTERYRAGDEDITAFQRPRHLYQLGVNYRWSSIVVDDQPTTETKEELERGAYGIENPNVVRAGDRAPDAPGLVPVGEQRVVSLFEVFTPTKHTTLIFVESPEEARPILNAIQGVPKGAMQTVVIFPRGASATSKVPGADLTLLDKEGHGFNDYPPANAGYRAIIVRPDAVVGAVVWRGDGIKQYVNKVFAVGSETGQLAYTISPRL